MDTKVHVAWLVTAGVVGYTISKIYPMFRHLRALPIDDRELYAMQHTTKSVDQGELLKELEEATKKETKKPMMLSGHMEGRFLSTLVQTGQAKRILEIGCFTGYSALCMAESLPEDGELITLDVSERFTKIAQSFWDKSPHGKKIHLRLGPALESMDKLEGTFDLIFIDADKDNYPAYFEKSLALLSRGGLIVIDNVFMSGSVYTWWKRIGKLRTWAKAIKALNDSLMQDERIHAVMLPIRDGVTLVRHR